MAKGDFKLTIKNYNPDSVAMSFGVSYERFIELSKIAQNACRKNIDSICKVVEDISNQCESAEELGMIMFVLREIGENVSVQMLIEEIKASSLN